MNLKIATRKSKLAQIQTEMIMARIAEESGIECEKVLVETKGDQILDVTLDKIGGKGLFVKELEVAMMEGRAHAAVHSMKDVPFQMPEGFEIVAMPEREDVRDAFVSINGVRFENLPKGAKVGTSSNRRAAQLKYMRPDLQIVPLRGNVQTRILKIEKENLDGIILAAAGLKRLDMEEIVMNYFDPTVFIPAVGQGALGIQILQKSEHKDIFAGLNNLDVSLCVEAERSFMRKLNGGCHSTLGAYAILQGERMYMVGIFEVNGHLVKKDIAGDKWEYLKLGEKLAEKIING